MKMRESFGYWEKRHLVEAVAALALNVSRGRAAEHYGVDGTCR